MAAAARLADYVMVKKGRELGKYRQLWWPIHADTENKCHKDNCLSPQVLGVLAVIGLNDKIGHKIRFHGLMCVETIGVESVSGRSMD